MKTSPASFKLIQVKISKLPIRLGQFLKFTGIVENGLEAKSKILGGEVLVNGVVELRRGRQLGNGDQIVIGEMRYKVENQD